MLHFVYANHARDVGDY